MTDPDSAGTDPLTAVIAEALADKFLCRTIPLHRDKPEHLCRTCKADKARMAAAVVAAVRAHQNTTDQQTAAQALRDAADALVTRSQATVRMELERRAGLLEASNIVRNRADTLDVAGEKSVPRCQYISPSPWGLTQCVLPDGHDGRHAYSPSETAANFSGDTGDGAP